LEQIANLGRQQPVPVQQLLTDVLKNLLRVGPGNLAVRLKAQALVPNVLVRDVRIDGKLDRNLGDHLLDLAAERRNRLGDHAYVQVKTDTSDVPGLFPTKQVP